MQQLDAMRSVSEAIAVLNKLPVDFEERSRALWLWAHLRGIELRGEDYRALGESYAERRIRGEF